MRKIAIVGAGQGGILLAIALLKNGYQVTLFSNRTAEQIRSGRILSSQVMYHSALTIEQHWGLNFWDDLCPWNFSFTSTVRNPEQPTIALRWQAQTAHPFQSIDQRLKISRWLEEFVTLGGNLIIQEVGLAILNSISKEHELTIIASGKGEISQAFTRDDARSPFDKPMRSLAALYVTGMQPVVGSRGMRATIMPEIGEFTTVAALTLTGPCDIMVFEAIPGGAMDCWRTVTDPQQRLNLAKELVQHYFPWEAERCNAIQLTDPQATLTGAFPPIVRKPLLSLPNGKQALGMGDTVMLNDPLSGQGANNATKCAAVYLARILERQQQPFDADWMQQTFEQYWQQYGQAAAGWTQLILDPPTHFLELISTCAKSPAVAALIANTFDNPNVLFPWIRDAQQTRAMIEKLRATDPNQN